MQKRKIIKILTTYSIPESKEWLNNTYFIPIKGKVHLFGVRDWFLPIRLLWKRSKYDVLITGAEREDLFFALLQTLLIFGKKPHIVMCCLWKKEKNFFIGLFKKLLLKSVNISISKFIVWSTDEIMNYSLEFKISKEKFIFLPHHASVEGYKYLLKDEGYIFAGGNSSRDYKTLIEAVRGTGIKTKIALTDFALIEKMDLPPNVEILSPTKEEFRELMARSRLVIVPLKAGLLQSAGQQTYLNAMMMKKPVIVSDIPGVRDYIEDRKTGYIVKPENILELKCAIKEILSKDGKVISMVKAAYDKASQDFSLQRFVERNLSLAETEFQNFRK